MNEELSKLPSPAYFEERDALALLVPRAKVLAALADAYAPAGAAVPVDIAINHHSEDLPMHSALPAAPTAVATWPQGKYPHLPQSVGDVTDFGDGKVDIDWGHPAPAGGTRLYSAEQMRAYVDADRAARAEQHAAVAGPADMRNALRWAAGGLRAVADDNDTLRIGSETRTVGEVLDAANAALEPAAPALEAPAAPALPADEFRGDTPSLVRNIIALLEMDAEGCLVPHGVGGSARGLLSAAAARLAAAPQAPAAPVYPAKFGPDDWIMVVAGIPVKLDEWSPGAVKARTIYGTPAVSVVDAETIHLQDLKNALAECKELRQQLTLMDEQQAGTVWRWQADGQDKLETMGNRMGVLIYACDLRALLAGAVPAVDASELEWLTKDGRAHGFRVLQTIEGAVITHSTESLRASIAAAQAKEGGEAA